VPPRIAPPPITAGQTRTADVHNLLDQMV
jgi:hypothetical protein